MTPFDYALGMFPQTQIWLRTLTQITPPLCESCLSLTPLLSPSQLAAVSLVYRCPTCCHRLSLNVRSVFLSRLAESLLSLLLNWRFNPFVYQRQRYFLGQSHFGSALIGRNTSYEVTYIFYGGRRLYIPLVTVYISPGHGLTTRGHGSYTPGVGGRRLLITPFVDVIGKKTISKEPR
jgi:hypothetical protein